MASVNFACKGLVMTPDSLNSVVANDKATLSKIDPDGIIVSKEEDWADLDGAWMLEKYKEQMKACKEWKDKAAYGEQGCC